MFFKKLLIAVIVLAALVWGAWLVAVPEALLTGIIEDSVKTGGLDIEVNGFRKGLFFSFTSESIEIKKSDKRLLSINGVSGRVDLLALPLMKVVMPFQGRVGSGELKGRALLRRKHYEVDLSVDAAQMQEIAFFGQAGLKGKGTLAVDVYVEDGRGEIKFAIEDAEFGMLYLPGSLSGFVLPLGMFQSARGVVRFKGQTVEVESLSIEGRGIYARAKGVIRGREVDMKLELMPEASVMPMDAFVILTSLISSYRVSPGYYVIPIKTGI